MSLKEFESIVGKEMCSAFIRMLKDIGPEARTHRISVVVAAMLMYALDQLSDECKKRSLGEALIALAEEPYLAQDASEESEKIHGLIEAICKKAGMQNHRHTSKGVPYSIAQNAIQEFTSWYNMPWET
jgi:cell division protein ZapA (FtsZ GTPase activity inhibitor)